jgi:hydroxymethylbilane synthase
VSQSGNLLRIGSRGSRLALVQAELVRAGLVSRAGTPCEIVVVKTSGDRIQDRPLADSGGKGLFTKELEEALLRDEIDCAVHSMKDVPTRLPPGLVIGAVLRREDPRDAFISTKARTLAELEAGARVGTSSVRRTAQLLRSRPDASALLLRGNVDTRLRKLEEAQYDAIILALAGLKRLGVEDRVTVVLDTATWLPALAQGAIGIEVREGDVRTRAAVGTLDDEATAVALSCERAFQEALDGSCRTPIAGLATFEARTLRFRGEVLSPDGSESAETEFELALGADARADAGRAGRNAGLALRPRAAQWLGI